jgi:hypothetical protein
MNTETTSTLTPEPAQPISPVTTLIGLFIEPGKAFASIEKKSMIWLPLILSMLGGAALLFFYYQQVDFAWLQDKLIVGKEMDPAQREAALKFMSKNTLVIMSLIGALIGPPIVYAITALYYLMVAKVGDIPAGYVKWFALAAWASVPNLLGLVLGFIQIALSEHGRLAPNQLNPLTLNQLFFHIDLNLPWASLLDSINVCSVWTIILLVIGFQAFSKKSRVASIAIVLAPIVLILGVMAIFAARQS